MEGGGYILKQHIWNAARDTISEWTGQQLAECSLYGIRKYVSGAVLATHVDRLPLVSSAIINVDQDGEYCSLQSTKPTLPGSVADDVPVFARALQLTSLGK